MEISLREFTLDDKSRLVSLLNDLEVSRYLARVPYPYTEKDALWWIEEGCRHEIARVIEVDKQFVGVVGLNQGETPYAKRAELGYWLGRQCWGKGIAASAVRMLLDQYLPQLDVVKVFASVYHSNVASERVLEKCGFSREAILKRNVYKNDVYYDEYIYSYFVAEEA